MGRAAPAPALQRRVALWLASLRATSGVTQEELATRLGIATRNLQRIESGTQNLTLQTIERVARALDVSPEVAFPIPDDRRGAPTNLHVVAGADHGRAPRAVPLLQLEHAAHFSRTGRALEVIGWTLLEGEADGRAFLCQVSGRAMEPLIPERSWSLFRGATDLVEGSVGLFELPRTHTRAAGALVVRRLVKRSPRAFTLAATNPSVAPLALTGRDRAALRVVARWVRVVAAR